MQLIFLLGTHAYDNNLYLLKETLCRQTQWKPDYSNYVYVTISMGFGSLQVNILPFFCCFE